MSNGSEENDGIVVMISDEEGIRVAVWRVDVVMMT